MNCTRYQQNQHVEKKSGNSLPQKRAAKQNNSSKKKKKKTVTPDLVLCTAVFATINKLVARNREEESEEEKRMNWIHFWDSERKTYTNIKSAVKKKKKGAVSEKIKIELFAHETNCKPTRHASCKSYESHSFATSFHTSGFRTAVQTNISNIRLPLQKKKRKKATL